MTRTYEYKAVVIIRVEAGNAIEAFQTACNIVDDLAKELPTGVCLVRKNDEPEVNPVA